MIYRYHRVIGIWMILCALIWLGTGIQTGWVTAGVWALALALLFPPMASIAAINPLTPGKSTLLPVFAFGGFLLLGGGAAESFGLDIDPVRIEIVACFGLMMTALFELGWRRAIDAGPGPDVGRSSD